MKVYLLIDVVNQEILGIYGSEEKAKDDIKKLPKYTVVNISKPIELNKLINKED